MQPLRLDLQVILDGRANLVWLLLAVHVDVRVLGQVVRLAVLDVEQVIPPLLCLLHDLPHLINTLEDLDILLFLTAVLLHCLEATQGGVVILSPDVSDDGLAIKDLQSSHPIFLKKRQLQWPFAYRLFGGLLLKAKDVILVLTPSEDRTIRRQRERRVLHHDDLHNLLVRQGVHLAGNVGHVKLAVTQLPLAAISPAKHLSAHGERNDVFWTHLDVHDLLQRAHLLRDVFVDHRRSVILEA
mmetsp:Transcript_660/g.1758  ORF Transcript_660/g.1758 Transcript_660/m.1758 type:complete len:241 (+) Transcript_660:987-1709(+)